MERFIPTLILRHRKENLKKCSLRGLENRKDLIFYTYPTFSLPSFENTFLLSFDGPEISPQDKNKQLFLVDGTWRYAEKMCQSLPNLPKRSLPKTIQTAYPRRQGDCSDPSRGLASVEALYAAYLLMGRDPSGLLDLYHWKEAFFKLNSDLVHNETKNDTVQKTCSNLITSP